MWQCASAVKIYGFKKIPHEIFLQALCTLPAELENFIDECDLDGIFEEESFVWDIPTRSWEAS